jgi:hypothetical protein
LATQTTHPAIHEAEQQMKNYELNSWKFIMDCRAKPGNDEREI